MIYRGIDLKTSIGHEVKQAGQVIEVYPFAIRVRLSGKTMPRKTAKQGLSFIRDKVVGIVPGLTPYYDLLDHDLHDAAVAAYTALPRHQNRAEA